jgi:hypothetical protein
VAGPVNPNVSAKRMEARLTRDEASGIISNSIQKVLADDFELLELGVTERALTHRLALYMEENVQRPLVVDCEYNRHFRYPKRVQLMRGASHDGRIVEVAVIPDIILHQRNTDDKNLIALEVKKPGMNHDHDYEKLRAFRNQLYYRHVAHLVLGIGSDGEVVNELNWLDD